MSDLATEFHARGLVGQVSDPGLFELLARKRVPFYTGYDPTAPSLQIGNLFAIVTMRRLQLAGHRPVVVMGGATGMIGDPSGKSQERNLLDPATIADNLAGQRRQFERLLDFDPGPAGAVIVNNHDWLGPWNFLEFLRDVGKRFRLGEMLAKESVRKRLQSPEGISFTEFTYQVLQAYDFLHLHREHGVMLQLGGGDQWGNITAGIDLIRKLTGETAYGMVIPLVTDAQGKKFGKSEAGTIYLDPELTSPYQMYQYLLNADDRSVITYLRYFTFLTLEEIAALERKTAEHPETRAAQKTLAAEVVRMVHGKQGLRVAERATRIFFGEKIAGLAQQELDAVFRDVPSITLPRSDLATGINVVDLLARTPLYKSKGEARRAVTQNGASLNNERIASIERTVGLGDLATPAALVLRKGRKHYCLVRIT